MRREDEERGRVQRREKGGGWGTGERRDNVKAVCTAVSHLTAPPHIYTPPLALSSFLSSFSPPQVLLAVRADV